MSQFKNERPYARESVKKLEQIFNRHDFNKKVLRALSAELKTRTTKNAKLLRGKVEAQLIEIRNREQFWRDKDAKAKAEKKTKPQERKSKSNLLANPTQPPKQEQGSLLGSVAVLTSQEEKQVLHSESTDPALSTESAATTESRTDLSSKIESLSESPRKRRFVARCFVALIVILTCISGALFYDWQEKTKQQPLNDPYTSLLNRGLSHKDVRFILEPILLEGGIEENSIWRYFARHDRSFPKKYTTDISNAKETQEIDDILIQRMGAYEKQVRALLN